MAQLGGGGFQVAAGGPAHPQGGGGGGAGQLEGQELRSSGILIAAHGQVGDHRERLGRAWRAAVGPAHQQIGAAIAQILQAQAVGGGTAARRRGEPQGDVARGRAIGVAEQEAQGAAAGLLQGEAEVGELGRASLQQRGAVAVAQRLTHVVAIEEEAHLAGHIEQAVALAGEQAAGQIQRRP